MEMNQESTIAAISTALGDGAISIVRLSGKDAVFILNQVFVPKRQNKTESHKLTYGTIHRDGTTLDEVLVAIMLAPNTYTKEDVVEINCHGGLTSARTILSLLLDKGARLAEPGEFTKRAFLNGRIDLTQAEAVIDIIYAKTNVARHVAVNMLQGQLGTLVRQLRGDILTAIAALEVAIDYPDEGYFSEHEQVKACIRESQVAIEEIIDAAKWDNILKNGIDTVILGQPNVGKSSLLNTLLKEERAIVTDIPGTTRDIITASLNINSIPINIIDTAGIRQTEDVIEQMGQERAFRYVDQADLVMVVLDGSQAIEQADLDLIEKAKANEKNVILLVNKIDLNVAVDLTVLDSYACPVVKISAKEALGIEAIDTAVSSFYPNVDVASELMVANMRHKASLVEALEALNRGQTSMEMGQSEEFVSMDLTNAYEALGVILGEEMDEDIINKIFSDFCLGK